MYGTENKIIPGYGKLTTNDQDNEATNLRPGDYQFVEEKAPKDYDIDKTIEFTIVKVNRRQLLLLRQITSLKVASL